MKRAKIQLLSLLLLLNTTVLAGCFGDDSVTGNEDEEGDDTARADAVDEPVTLHVYDINAGISEDVFNELFIAPVGEAHPNLSFEHTTGSGLDGLEDMMASREVPDIITASFSQFPHLMRMELASDLRPLAEKNHMNLDRFDPVVIEITEQFGQAGELYGIPFSMNTGVLAYNKDIFDLFGVDYLTDGMTWNEVMEVARQLSGEQGGASYLGLAPQAAHNLTRAYPLPVVDEATEEVVIENGAYSEGYREVFSLIRDMYRVPGAIDDGGNPVAANSNVFINQAVAMLPNWIAAMTILLDDFEEAGLSNWDVVSWPVFEHEPGVGRQADFHVMILPPTSENHDAAFNVVETLVSEENQEKMNSGERGLGTRVTVLDDQEMRMNYGSEFPQFADKNIEGIFTVDTATVPPLTPYTDEIHSILQNVAVQMGTEDLDVNTALRIAQEEAEIVVQEMKQQE